MNSDNLTKGVQKTYSKVRRDIFMPDDGREEIISENVRRATERLEEVARRREEVRRQAAAKSQEEQDSQQAKDEKNQQEPADKKEKSEQTSQQETIFSSRLTPEAEDLLKKAGEGVAFTQFTSNLIRILRENGIPEDIIQKGNMDEMLDMLRAKANSAKGDGEGKGSEGEESPTRKTLTKGERLEELAREITDSRLNQIKDEMLASLKTSQTINASMDEKFMREQMDKVGKFEESHSIGEDQLQSFREYVSTLTARESDEYVGAMNDIRGLKEGSPERIKAVMDLLKEMTPYSATLPPDFIREVAKDRRTLDYLVIRIIGQSLDAEESGYSQSFYGGINLDTLKDVLKTKGEKGDAQAKNNYNRTLITAEAAQLFHTMNLMIITGKMGGFVENSESITPEQLQIMQNIKGVSQIMRIFDEEILRLLNRDSAIKGKNYDEMMGLKRNADTGEIIGWEEGAIEKKFRGMIRAGAVEGFDKNKLDEWEIKWAFHVGRIMTNLSLRTSEQISLNKVQKGDYTMASWPLEKASRLFNWLGLTALRYNLGDVRGGIFLAKLASKIFQDQRKEQGYGKCGIKKLGWTNIDDFELAGLCNVNGIWQSWRSNIVLLNQAPTAIPEKDPKPGKPENMRKKTIKEIIDEVSKYRSKETKNPMNEEEFILLEKDKFIEELKKKDSKIKGKKLDKILQGEAGTRLKEVFLKNGELNTDNFNNALGIILKHNFLTSSGKDTQELRDAKEEVRAAIWRSVAKDNPLAILPFLQGTKYVKDKDSDLVDKRLDELEGLKKLDKLDEIDITEGDLNFKQDVDRKKWDLFADKLSILHEIRMQKLKEGTYESLEVTMKNQKDNKELELNAEEKKWLKNIENKGKDISGDLANVRFPSIPFMNDTIFERSNYSEAGKNYYGRRAGGDLASWYKLGESFGELMINPGKAKPEEALEIMGKIINAIQEPLGTEFAQDRTSQFFEAYLTFIEKGGYLGVDIDNGIKKKGPIYNFSRWAVRDNIWSAIETRLRKPTSIAQRISGTNAVSLDETAMRDLLDTALKDGVTRKPLYDKNGIALYTDLDEKFRKKMNAGFLGILFAYIRDFPKIFLAGAISEFTQKSVKENK